jgi:hypothetical protein
MVTMHTICRQEMLLYEEATDDWGFEMLCRNVASEATMHPEFVSLLKNEFQRRSMSRPSPDLADHTSETWYSQHSENNKWRLYQERISHSASESMLGNPFTS